MIDSYIQYASGYNKDQITMSDIKKAISDVELMDEEHGAFWVSVITDDENVIEVNKDLMLSIIFKGEELKYQAANWHEVESLLSMLLNKNFEEIKNTIN